MTNRNTILKQIRQDQIGEVYQTSSIEETFQNQTLRPILKFQNDLIIAVFIAYCIQQKNTFFKLPVNKKLEYIEQNIQRDQKFRDFLKGIIIALFSNDEYKIYSQDPTAHNKRLIAMLIERLKSQVQLIENNN